VSTRTRALVVFIFSISLFGTSAFATGALYVDVSLNFSILGNPEVYSESRAGCVLRARDISTHGSGRLAWRWPRRKALANDAAVRSVATAKQAKLHRLNVRVAAFHLRVDEAGFTSSTFPSGALVIAPEKKRQTVDVDSQSRERV
jgi:hypothetical protein